MADYFIGTMGFSYQDWAGSFYPPGVKARDYLVHYSRVFNAVEIDSTFYGIPKSSSIVRWRDQSPSDFKICLKVPRSITHEAGLVGTQREMDRFIEIYCPIGGEDWNYPDPISALVRYIKKGSIRRVPEGPAGKSFLRG